MGYAVELYFDRQTEQSVRTIRRALAEAGIPPVLEDAGEDLLSRIERFLDRHHRGGNA